MTYARRRFGSPLLALAASSGVALVVAGCGGGDHPRPATPQGAPPRFTLRVGVRPKDGHIWRQRIAVRPGQTIEQLIELSNVGGEEQARDVRVRVELRGHERPVLASEYIRPLGVSVASSNELPAGLFGKGARLGAFPGGGTASLITFETRVGKRGFSEPVELRWDGGNLRRSVQVAVG